MLPVANRLRHGKDFARTTKTGVRATSFSLVFYALTHPEISGGPKVGLIVNKSIGGSVVRHRVSRQLRHLIAPYLPLFSEHTQLVIRVLRKSGSYQNEVADLVAQLQKRTAVKL